MNNQVSLLKRGIAFLVDLYLGTLVSSLPISIITMISLDKMTQNVFLLEKPLAILSLILSIICLVFYYIGIPSLFYSRQTLGKRLMDIQVTYDLKRSFILRQTTIMLIFTSGSRLLGQLLSLLSGYNIMNLIMDLSMSLSLMIIIGVVFSKQHIALYDRLFHTDIRNISKKNNKK